MSIAFVIGNGISRQGIALEHLSTLGKVYGCNSLHKDFVPDVLVATDRPISTFIQESGYSSKHTFYTRRPLPSLGALQVPKEYHGFSSGPIAVSLAALDQHTTVYLVGFDMGPAENKTFNNMYADTEFYRASGTPPTYTGNWIKQLCKIAHDFPKTLFIRVQGKTTAYINEFEIVKNIQHVTMDTFVDRINNQKDL